MEITMTGDGNIFLLKNLPKIVIEALHDELTFKVFDNYTRQETKLVFIKNPSKGIYLIPIGFWKKLYTTLKKFQLVKLLDTSWFFRKIDDNKVERAIIDWNLLYDPRHYQFKAVLSSLKYKVSRNDLETGVGKTLTLYCSSRYMIENGYVDKVLILAPRKSLIRQFEKNIVEFETNYPQEKRTQISTIYDGGKINDDAKIVIGTQASIKNMNDEWFKQFGALMVDECHTFLDANINIRKRMNLDLFSVYAVSGTNRDDNTIESYSSNVFFGEITYRFDYKKAIVDETQPIAELVVRQLRIEYSKEDRIAYWRNPDFDDYSNRYTYDLEWFSTICGRKLKTLKQIINKFHNLNHLIFVKRVEHIKFLEKELEEDGVKIFTIWAKTSNKKRDAIFEEIENSNNCRLITTFDSLNMGVSINHLHINHLYDHTKSPFVTNQSIGRMTRKHKSKKYGIVFDYVDVMRKISSIMSDLGGTMESTTLRHGRMREKIYAKKGIRDFRKIILKP